jgi:hypothetical protein
MMRVARCGSAARFLVDLLEVCGYEAGLIAGACHTAAEVRLGGDWRLLDPSLYPMGAALLDAAGELIKTDEVIAHPDILDRIPSYINYNSSHIDAFSDLYITVAGQIERYLRYPILPSSGYFGREFAGERAGRLFRYRKLHDPGSRWTDWRSLHLVEELRAPAIGSQFRPEQVKGLEFDGSVLRWAAARTHDGSSRVLYDVYVSDVSRGWIYEDLPDDCRFTVPGRTVRTSRLSLNAPGLLSPGTNYVTIIARNPDVAEAFHLPSNEFLVYV